MSPHLTALPAHPGVLLAQIEAVCLGDPHGPSDQRGLQIDVALADLIAALLVASFIIALTTLLLNDRHCPESQALFRLSGPKRVVLT